GDGGVQGLAGGGGTNEEDIGKEAARSTMEGNLLEHLSGHLVEHHWLAGVGGLNALAGLA
mgnify:CR=1